MSVRIHLVMAARPNFMKVAPLWHELSRHDWADPVLIHTGQHYDENLSDSFLRDLGLPEPDHNLGVGSGSHAEQTAGVMVAYERVCLEDPADWVVVVGDVNSTLACALTAKKLQMSVAHLEAGLRSGDRSMPEEINRIVTDSIADVLWTPSQDADENLVREGIARDKIVCVGNIMIDSLEMLRPRIEAEQSTENLELSPGQFGVVTLHRPANVDSSDTLSALVSALIQVASEIHPLVFPVHPRTRKNLEEWNLWELLTQARHVTLTEPMPYIAFMKLVFDAAFVVTDSGGLQEESTYLGIPCFTLRPNTERPITILEGTNRLIQAEELAGALAGGLNNTNTSRRPPLLWDGMTATRVAGDLRLRIMSNPNFPSS